MGGVWINRTVSLHEQGMHLYLRSEGRRVEMLEIFLSYCANLEIVLLPLFHSCFTTRHGHTIKSRDFLLSSSLHPAAVAARVGQDSFTSFLPPQVALHPDL